MDQMKVYISSPQDRDAVVLALTRNGYTVRQGTEKKNGRTYVKYVEFWKEDGCAKSEKDGDSV